MRLQMLTLETEEKLMLDSEEVGGSRRNINMGDVGCCNNHPNQM